MIHLEDSRDPDDPIFSYTNAEWKAFIDSIRNGNFDDLRITGSPGMGLEVE
jgi:hypothetical protein